MLVGQNYICTVKKKELMNVPVLQHKSIPVTACLQGFGNPVAFSALGFWLIYICLQMCKIHLFMSF